MVDFVIAGTFKGASSTLAFELGGHPTISIPRPKDPYFYLGGLLPLLTGPQNFMQANRTGAVLDRAAFDGLFPDDGDTTLKGEATPLYLYCHDHAIPAIRADNPDTKIILILRNPVDRAFSNFHHNTKQDHETRSFAACIDTWQDTEALPLHPFFHYVRAGFYDAQVAAYQAAFAHVKVITYEQVVHDTHLVLNEIAEFLGITPEFQPERKAIRLNKSGAPRYPALHRFLLQENPVKTALRPLYRTVLRNPYTRKRVAEQVKNFNIESQQMALADRARLNALYASDIARVSERVGLDLVGRWGL